MRVWTASHIATDKTSALGTLVMQQTYLRGLQMYTALLYSHHAQHVHDRGVACIWHVHLQFLCHLHALHYNN